MLEGNNVVAAVAIKGDIYVFTSEGGVFTGRPDGDEPGFIDWEECSSLPESTRARQMEAEVDLEHLRAKE